MNPVRSVFIFYFEVNSSRLKEFLRFYKSWQWNRKLTDKIQRMKIITALLLLSFLNSCTTRSQPPSFTLYSTEISDSFDIYVTLPANYDTAKTCSIVYYLDASINSGNHLRKLIASQPDSLTKNMIFAGIGHRGNFHEKRRRDFIPPEMHEGSTSPGNDKNYGQADRFYTFLITKVIPSIESKYRVNAQRTLAGHSFGGLFGFYCLFKKDRQFQKFIAMSPSLWVNNYNILEYEAAYAADESALPVFLYLSAGGRENLNYILQGNRKMKALLEKRNYKGLSFESAIHKGKTHNSQVLVSLSYLLKNRKF
jgi:uncharacterized protein